MSFEFKKLLVVSAFGDGKFYEVKLDLQHEKGSLIKITWTQITKGVTYRC